MTAFADAMAVFARVLLLGALAYALIAVHTWRHNAWRRSEHWSDVALAAMLGASVTVIALSDVEHIAPGALALGLLMLAHGTLVNVRGRGARHATSDPLLLLYHGVFSPAALDSAGLSREQILAGLRERGVDPPSPGDVLILESSGEIRLFRMALGGPVHITSSDHDRDPRLN